MNQAAALQGERVGECLCPLRYLLYWESHCLWVEQRTGTWGCVTTRFSSMLLRNRENIISSLGFILPSIFHFNFYTSDCPVSLETTWTASHVPASVLGVCLEISHLEIYKYRFLGNVLKVTCSAVERGNCPSCAQTHKFKVKVLFLAFRQPFPTVFSQGPFSVYTFAVSSLLTGVRGILDQDLTLSDFISPESLFKDLILSIVTLWASGG